ncbi:HD domain-containing protein [bacterium]|nr:HD domain-containing protein [bacterium]
MAISQSKIKFKPLPRKVLEVLRSNANEIYYVGGYVRDVLLGLPTQDRDVLVRGPKLTDLVEILSPIGRAELVGKSFNLVRFWYKGERFDIVVPSRRTPAGSIPEPGMSLIDDLKCRDFTINAIAWDILKKQVIDPLKGLEDLENRLLRATGKNAFIDDPLRILRMCRLASKLGFKIDDGTFLAAKECANKLQTVFKERIGDEFGKIMLLEKPSIALKCLHEVGALEVILPELSECVGVSQPGGIHAYDVFEHILRTVDETRADLLVRFAALFHDITKPRHKIIGDDGRARFYGHQESSAKVASRWLKKFAFSHKLADNVAKLVRLHMFTHAQTEKGIRRFIRKVGEELLEPLFELRFADTKAQGHGDLEAEIKYKNRVYEVLSKKPPLSVKDLAVDGHDVMRILGIPPGKKVGEVLNFLLEKVLEDPNLNEKEKLEKLIIENFG